MAISLCNISKDQLAAIATYFQAAKRMADAIEHYNAVGRGVAQNSRGSWTRDRVLSPAYPSREDEPMGFPHSLRCWRPCFRRVDGMNEQVGALFAM